MPQLILVCINAVNIVFIAAVTMLKASEILTSTLSLWIVAISYFITSLNVDTTLLDLMDGIFKPSIGSH